jgi:hypothetical protein
LTDFNTKLVTKDKAGHFTLIKATMTHMELTTVNLHGPSNFINLTLLKNPKTITVGDFNTLLSKIDNHPDQKNKTKQKTIRKHQN